MKSILTALLFAWLSVANATGDLIAYPPVPRLSASEHYKVRARSVGGEWQNAFAWETACQRVEKKTDGYCDYFPHGGANKAAGVWVCSGEFKLLRWFGNPATHELYNLHDDPNEVTDLAAKMPDKVKQHDALIDGFLKDTGATYPRPNPAMLLAPQAALPAADVRPPAHWDRVPLNIHFGKRSGNVTSAEIDFLAKHSVLVTLEKGHGASAHGSTEAGVVDTARRLKQRNPSVKVLFYLNAFINWGGYEAFKTYRPEWTLRTAGGEIVTHTSGTPRPDPSNAAFREWWSNVIANEMKRGPIDGVFVDALPQALAPALTKVVGGEKTKAVVAGLREMIALTKRKMGADKIVLANGTRATDFREILDWEGLDGVMIEHFAAFRSNQAADIRADMETVALAAAKGKFVVVKGWPGFNWMDNEMMKRPNAELLKLAREQITFPLACFLVAARPGSLFCYSWGYTDRHGMLESYPELERPLGAALGEAKQTGWSYQRDFAHASVFVDLETKKARIEWKP